MANNAPFHIKSPVKNFHGRAKGGGHCTVALPLNTPLKVQSYCKLVLCSITDSDKNKTVLERCGK